MHIDDTQLPFDPAWEGDLEAAAGTFAARGGDAPAVSIGRPTWWDDADILGDAWTPPAGGARYGLARFPYSLRPPDGRRIERAEFWLHLFSRETTAAAGQPVAFDAAPRTTTAAGERTVSLSLGPSIKAGGAEASLGKAEVSVKLRPATAVITLDGLGESDLRWQFRAAGGQLLVGSQALYVVVERPSGVAARASLRLTVALQTPWGRWLGHLPEAAQERLSWALG